MAAGNTQTQDHTIVQMHESKQKIQKVPELLRGIQSNNGSEHPYSPMVVSIGPYHHGKPELMEMEKVKLEFVRLCFPSYSEEMYTTAINAGEARKFYSDGSIPTQFDNRKFSEMMFLDSCFILHFISCFLSKKGMGMKPHLEAFVIRDLLLLENQVPFSVLEAVMDLGKGSSKKEEGFTVEKIKEFVGNVRHCPITDEKVSRETVSERISSKCNEMFGKVRSLCFRTQSKTGDPKNVIPEPHVHLVELFHTQFTQQNPNPSESHQGQTWYCYRSAKELNNVGIHFRPSESNSFNDVTYKSYFFYGYLNLPPILIDDLSKSLLLNLAAYESCPDTPEDAFQVSSYIVFLDSLIDQAEDVKELRSKGVLLNSLGSDQEVADLFNEISKYLVIHPQAFRDARNGIDRRYQNKVKKWITEWLNNHFSSPWTVIAFVGASVGLGLTAIETYQSFFPPPTPS